MTDTLGNYVTVGNYDLIAANETRSGSSEPHVGLLPIADVQPTMSAVPSTVEMWCEEDFVEPPHVRRNGESVVDVSALQDAMLVSSLTQAGGKFFLCLAPVGSSVDVRGEGYELWDKGHAEITRYLSFGDWLDRSVSDCWHDPDDIFRSVNRGIDADAISRTEDWPPPLFVAQVRRLTAARHSEPLVDYLNRLWTWPDPYVRLASSQVLSRHVPDLGLSRLGELTASLEPTVALAAAKSISLLGDPMETS